MTVFETRKEKGASITVFFSLILLLILSFLFTIIEGARISTAKVFAERSLTTAMDSVLADFYGPLWEEYHIFGLDTDPAAVNGNIGAKLNDYMSYTFSPDKGLSPPGAQLYNISSTMVSVTGQTRLTDCQGELFINQAVEYMKYKETANLTEQLLGKMKLLSEPKKISYLYEEKQDLEEELVEIDEGILELMQALDGVKTSKKGLSVAKDGSLKTVSGFVKKIYFGNITQEAAGINQESVFLALKDQYCNPEPYFKSIDNDLLNIGNMQVSILRAENDLASLNDDITDTENQLAQLNAMSEKSEDTKAAIDALQTSLDNLEDRRNQLQDSIREYEVSKTLCISDIHTKESTIRSLITEIKPCINSALDTIDNIMIKVRAASPLINGYEASLSEAKGKITEEIYEGLTDDLTKLKSYIQTGEEGYDFEGMKRTLNNDLLLLSQVEAQMDDSSKFVSVENYQTARLSYSTALIVLKGYQTENLKLDYSSIVIDKSKGKNPLDAAGDFLENGLLSLVTDSSEISASELSTADIPSAIAAPAEGDEGIFTKLTDFFRSAVVGDKNSGMGNVFGDFAEDMGDLSTIGTDINALAEMLLFQEYIKEHFYSFPMESTSQNTRKPSALSYEQEYLLAGKTTDKENLSSMVTRLIFLRTIFDFVTILGDRDKCGEAMAAASALVGFTGLPILVSITKTLILLVWSFEEALLDVCALLMGKEVPIIKKDLILTFPELFLLSRSFLKEKAQGMQDTKELSLSYQEYLSIFLLFKGETSLAYRSMDMIQEDIRVRYLDDFSIQNCLYGYKVKAGFCIPSKFTGFKFVTNILGKTPQGYQFTVNATTSY